MLQYAIDIETKSLKHIDDVPNGKKCNCRCPECDDDLEAHNGGKIKAHHFKHTSKAETRSCLMTQLHLWGQYYFHNSNGFLIEAPIIYHQNQKIDGDQYITIRKHHSELERRVGNYFADVFIQTEIEDLIIEIKVTHECEQPKIDYLQENKIASVEIDLSEYINTPIAQLEKEFQEHEMKVSWIYPYDKEAIISQYLIEQELQRQEDIARARANAKKVFSALVDSNSIVLPALTTTYNTVDAKGKSISKHLVLQKQTKAIFDEISSVSTDEYYWYICQAGGRSLNIVGYFEDQPDELNAMQDSTVILHPSSHTLSWHFHSRMEDLMHTVITEYEDKRKSEAFVTEMIISQENNFEARDCCFKMCYGRWRSIVIENKLFFPSESRKNPPIPKGMKNLSKDETLWMFDAWPVYAATVLLSIFDFNDKQEKLYDDLFMELTREIGISKQYMKIIDYMEGNGINPSVYRLDKKSIIKSLLRTALNVGYLESKEDSIVKATRAQPILGYLYSFQ